MLIAKNDRVSFAFIFFCIVIALGIGYLAYSAFSRGERNENRDKIRTSDPISVTITDEKATELLRSAVPESMPLDSLNLSFMTRRVRISGNADVNKILSAAVIDGYPDIGALKAILPDNVSFSAVFEPAAGAYGINLQPKEFSLSSYRIPLAFLPSGLKESLDRAINAAVESTGLKITGIEIDEGSATIQAE
jgi:hypothetical protein